MSFCFVWRFSFIFFSPNFNISHFNDRSSLNTTYNTFTSICTADIKTGLNKIIQEKKRLYIYVYENAKKEFWKGLKILML